MGRGRIVVSNSTPLINFATIRRIDILRFWAHEQLYQRILAENNE